MPSSYTAGVAGPMWPQEPSHHNWYSQDKYYQQDMSHGNWNLWGHEQPKQWGQSKHWEQDKLWDQKEWGHDVYGRQDHYAEYNNFQGHQAPSQLLDNRLRQQASSQLAILAEEPDEVLLVNSLSSGAYRSLCADASAADLVGFDAEWAPDRAYGSDNPISVLQLAFPLSRRVYVIQLNCMNGRLPAEVKMMLVNPEVRKIGFAVDLNDRTKMARSGIGLTESSVTDVQDLCAIPLGVIAKSKSLSLKYAAFGLLGMKLEKDKRISCSDWAGKELTPEQIHYAALDAWVPLRLCYQLS